ncbi:MAG: hypothetical protein ACUVUS_10110 [Thermoproteota archaeon]
MDLFDSFRILRYENLYELYPFATMGGAEGIIKNPGIFGEIRKWTLRGLKNAGILHISN